MHPQVHIVDGSSKEEAVFMKGVRSYGYKAGKPVIELPPDAAKNLMWMTRLDTGSLSGKAETKIFPSSKLNLVAWHKTYVDIVIHAPRESSGSLIRLLKSIVAADYFGTRRPHLTIELPPDIDSPTMGFLQNLIWPPLDPSGGLHSSQVTLRHRIPRAKLGTEEASTHFLENFYPARPKDSHVLILSPQAEVSPLYYHYLIYNLLEYKYSSYGSTSPEADSLMGISLELPSHHLNDTEPFSPPLNKLVSGLGKDGEPVETAGPPETLPFLWQAPNSNAALYFGDKWIELHTFFTARISARQINRSPLPSRPKLVSSKYPAWMEYMLEFMHVKGYNLLYPHFESRDSIVTVHNELYQPPEEFASSASSSADITPLPTQSNQDPNEPFTVDPQTISTPHSHSPEIALLKSSLINLLPHAGDLPELSSIPLLTSSGDLLLASTSYKHADSFAETFSREIGGCKVSKRVEPWKRFSVDELFCYDDEDEDQAVGTIHSLPEEGHMEQGPGQESISRLFAEKSTTDDEFSAHLARQAGSSR